MPNARIPAPSLFGGVSRQPESQRFANQVENADNILLSVANGASKRPGADFVAKLAGFTVGKDIRIHVIDRDQAEQYLIVYGEGFLKIFDASDGSEATVNISAASNTYLNLNAANADQFSLATEADFTLIGNKTVPMAAKTSPAFVEVGGSPFADYEAMIAGGLVDGEFAQTTNDSNGRVRGFWKKDSTDPKANADDFLRVPPPDQAEAELDETTMPHQIVRISITPLIFDVDPVDWGFRITGDSETNPVPELFNSGIKLADMAFFDSRLLIAGDEFLQFSQAQDLFNFYVEDFANVIDSDPVPLDLGTGSVNLADFLVSFNRTVTVFTKSGKQFEVREVDKLTPANGAIRPTTEYNSLANVKPVGMGRFVYFPSAELNSGQIWEYQLEQLNVTSQAFDISAHVRTYMKVNLKTMTASSNNTTIAIIPRESNEIYIYRALWQQEQKVQSAWATYFYSDEDVIRDIGVIENDIYVIMELSSGDFLLLRQPIPQTFVDLDAIPYDPMLDHRQLLTGTFNALDNETTWDYGFDDDTLDQVVLGPDFGDDAGFQVLTTRVNNNSIKASRDFSGGEAFVGQQYLAELELSRPFVKDQSGAAILDGILQHIEVITSHENTGAYTVRISRSDGQDRDSDFKPRSIGVSLIGVIPASEDGSKRTRVLGRADTVRVKIRNQTPLPMIITSAEHIGQFTRRG